MMKTTNGERERMGWIILALAAAAGALYLLRRTVKDRHDRELELIERSRTTALYRQLYPILVQCENCCVEQILIRAEEIRIRMYRPMNQVVRFHFEEHGLDVIDQPEALSALAKAIPMDVPSLDDLDKFWFVRKTAPRDAGGSDVWYEYNVQPDHKDLMLRAWYDRPEPEDGIVR